jgi:hypothetical protein
MTAPASTPKVAGAAYPTTKARLLAGRFANNPNVMKREPDLAQVLGPSFPPLGRFLEEARSRPLVV